MTDTRRTQRPPATATCFGELLAAYRQDRGLTQHQLANAAGCDGAYISRLEAGKREPSRETVDALADALEATYWQRNKLITAAGYLPNTIGLMSLVLNRLSDMRRSHHLKHTRYAAHFAYEALNVVYLDILNTPEEPDANP